ncbi:hypothetical protein C4E44_29035, partial [Pseudomonas sp. MWU12-2312b]
DVRLRLGGALGLGGSIKAGQFLCDGLLLGCTGFVAWTDSHILISLSDHLPAVGSPPLSRMSYPDSGMRRANAKYVHTERIQDDQAKQEISHER